MKCQDVFSFIHHPVITIISIICICSFVIAQNNACIFYQCLLVCVTGFDPGDMLRICVLSEIKFNFTMARLLACHFC